MEINMSATGKETRIVKILPVTIKDDGKVRIGMVSPTFPQAHPEPTNVIDRGRVRTGFVTPAFPPLRAR